MFFGTIVHGSTVLTFFLLFNALCCFKERFFHPAIGLDKPCLLRLVVVQLPKRLHNAGRPRESAFAWDH